MSNYLYELKIFGGEDGDDLIIKVEAYSEESLLEQLRKVDYAIKSYENEQEVRMQEAIDRAKEEEPEEGMCPDCGIEPLDEKEERCPECEAARIEINQE